MMLSKIFLGISLSAPFGPLSAAALNRGIQSGFMGAFTVRFGGAIGNLCCLIAAFFFVSALYKLQSLSSYITVLSSFALLALGIKQFRNSNNLSLTIDPQYKNRGDIIAGFILAIVNPYGVIWWLSIYSASLSNDENEINTIESFYDNLYIILGVLIWIVIFSFIISLIREKFPLKVLILITKLSSISLIGYGAYYFYLSL